MTLRDQKYFFKSSILLLKKGSNRDLFKNEVLARNLYFWIPPTPSTSGTYLKMDPKNDDISPQIPLKKLSLMHLGEHLVKSSEVTRDI